MTDRRIQTKRQKKRGFRTLLAKTAVRKHKASTANAADMDDMEGDIPKVGIGRALTVILILHVVAIAAIYMGTKWKGSEPAGSNAVAAFDEENKDASANMNSGSKDKFKVGIPPSYQFTRSPEVSHEMPQTTTRNTSEAQQVEPRRPRVILPKRNPNAHENLPPAQPVNYKSYKLVAGDTIYRIALRNKVKQQEILDLNNIADARKMRVGMVIKVPVK